MEHLTNAGLLGTPLPEASGRNDRGAFTPAWKQEVRDSRGRRRLHGAFTGGFSAGYFNTVGSKEGWAPASYVSSRNARASIAAMKAKDIMDEEDLQEQDDNRLIVPLHPTKHNHPHDDIWQGELIGQALLECMGWEEIAGGGLSKDASLGLEKAGRDKSGLGTITPDDSIIRPSRKSKTPRSGFATGGRDEASCVEIFDADDEEPYHIRPVFLGHKITRDHPIKEGNRQPYTNGRPEIYGVRGFIISASVSHSKLMDLGLPVLPDGFHIGCPYDTTGSKNFIVQRLEGKCSEEGTNDSYVPSGDTSARDRTSNSKSLSNSAASYMSNRFQSSFDQRPTSQSRYRDPDAKSGASGRFLGNFIPSRLLCKRFGVDVPAADTRSLTEVYQAEEAEIPGYKGSLLSVKEEGC